MLHQVEPLTISDQLYNLLGFDPRNRVGVCFHFSIHKLLG